MSERINHPVINGVVPAQREKLLYLIKVRGDQRTRKSENSTEVLDDGNDDFPSLCLVTNQSSLAEALGTTETTVSRWIANNKKDKSSKPPKPIDIESRRRLCKIYKIPLHAFNTLGFDEFVKNCHPVLTDWHELVAASAISYGRILNEPPYIGIRYAEPHFGEDKNPVAQVPVETPFWVEFTSPRADKNRSEWAGWHVLLFNHDVHQSGFKCYLPRYQSETAFAVKVFPDKGDRLALPRQPILWHRRLDAGSHFEMVLVVCRDVLPPEIMENLSRDISPAAIEKDLQALATWITDPLRQGAAAIARVPYVVIEKKAG